jgi:DNA-binding IclR family transcriptional regulator
MRAAAPKTQRGPLSLDRIFAILTNIANDPHGRTLTRLSEELQTPKTSLLNLLAAATAAGYLTRSGHRYRLGPQAFHLARVILHSRQDIATLARPLLQRLAVDTDTTATLCVLAPDERAILHLVKEECQGAMRFMIEEGHRAPLHTTAGGKVILAYRPGAWAEHFLRHARLSKNTRHTITDPDHLRAAILEVQEHGYAITRGETYETVGAIAAPVFDADGFVAAVVAAGAVERVIARTEELRALVRDTADELSVLLGHDATKDDTGQPSPQRTDDR